MSETLETPPERTPRIRLVAMPADTNPRGDIFGGWLMSQMDLAGAVEAAFRAGGRCSTVAVNGLVFLRPVLVGDEVSLYAELMRVGRTSLTVHVQAWRRGIPDLVSQKVTAGDFTFVAIDENRRPRPVPPSLPHPEGVDWPV
jgi:acyl-CoA thioesterase YciA